MLNIRELPPLLAKKAIDELNEDPKYIKDSVELFREWIIKQPHLNGCTDDQWLVYFLRTCKYRLELAKEKYDNFYSMRTAMSDYFYNRDINDRKFQEIIKLGNCIPLDKLEREDDPSLYFFCAGSFNPGEHRVQDIFKTITMMVDIQMMKDDNLPISGVTVVIDFVKLSASHILQFEVPFIRKLAVFIQNASGLRVKAIHMINLSVGIETFVTFVNNTFLNKKNRERITVHSNMDSLYKAVPQHLLPSEYGGNAGYIPDIMVSWIEKIKSNSNILKLNEEYGTDERKRCGKPKDSASLFGIEGSFRKLTVD